MTARRSDVNLHRAARSAAEHVDDLDARRWTQGRRAYAAGCGWRLSPVPCLTAYRLRPRLSPVPCHFSLLASRLSPLLPLLARIPPDKEPYPQGGLRPPIFFIRRFHRFPQISPLSFPRRRESRFFNRQILPSCRRGTPNTRTDARVEDGPTTTVNPQIASISADFLLRTDDCELPSLSPVTYRLSLLSCPLSPIASCLSLVASAPSSDTDSPGKRTAYL